MRADAITHFIGGVAWIAFGISEFTHISPYIKGVLGITAGLFLIFMAWLEEWGW